MGKMARSTGFTFDPRGLVVTKFNVTICSGIYRACEWRITGNEVMGFRV